MRELKLILPYPPSVNTMYATFRGRRILSKKGRKFKSDVRELIDGMGITELMTGDIKIIFNLFRPKKIGDLENYQKASIDSMNGLIFVDDKQIIEIHSYRHEDKLNPRAEVDIVELD